MGAQFLKVDFEEDGSGAGGYAKEMSAEWHAAAREMLLKQCGEVDVIVTTALIPGRKAPVMIDEEMVKAMGSGSVTVDLSCGGRGQCRHDGRGSENRDGEWRHLLRYTDLPSRLARTSTDLYANNITKFFLSAGPFTTKVADEFVIDHEDEAVRPMLVLDQGKSTWPYTPPPPPVVETAERSGRRSGRRGPSRTRTRSTCWRRGTRPSVPPCLWVSVVVSNRPSSRRSASRRSSATTRCLGWRQPFIVL